jgi:hypothetical protein
VKEQVAERVDRVISAIRKIQGPCMRGEKAADVLVVSIFLFLQLQREDRVLTGVT